ncbi:serpin family protein [Candidatus Nitrosotenuis chungbukensis]|uniref:serpin family protein n=1 Tax=Candidatus Nitrosotenuis chungbukensis TaxID=1353246 RepID=UPI000693BD8C|nr:serpin family protein [Candidatus Nitrosotenuis chungbukensis]WKT57078.1 serpin family protein [Candidatus Nitrosotenuis chungbukensis]
MVNTVPGISDTPPTEPTEIKESTQNIVDASNRFMFDYYSISGTSDDNVFFSPWSILSAFSVLHEGARGETADEISSAFYLPEDDSARRMSFESMQSDLNINGSGYDLRNANALWIQAGFGVKEDFINTARQYYDSEVSEVNFPADESIIDSWVEDKTNDKIKDLVKGKTNDLTMLVITNAVYFKGTWKTQFEPSQTSEGEFRVNVDKTVQVPMMYLKSEFAYAETDDLQILSMPYDGERISMLVLLPKNGIEPLEQSLTVEQLDDWKKNLAEREVMTFVPKFKLETEYELPKIMQELGIKLAFDEGNADLSGIANMPPRLFVTAAVHKAFVDVNEEGTEAAAATGIGVGTTSVGPELPIFRADHPFVFLIQDNETGLVLFMGKISDPIK